jgi:DNA-binding transcriptional LysR family regulator
MLSVSIRQIEYIVAVAEQGGVTAAADALHVSQPALSVAISRLEQHLGNPLFIRRKGCAVLPTAFGRNFLEEANQILQSLTRLVEPGALQTRRYQPIVEVRIADDLNPEPIVIATNRLNPPVPVARKLIDDIIVLIAKAIS